LHNRFSCAKGTSTYVKVLSLCLVIVNPMIMVCLNSFRVKSVTGNNFLISAAVIKSLL